MTARPFKGAVNETGHAVDPVAYLRREGKPGESKAKAYCGSLVHVTAYPVEITDAWWITCATCKARYVREVEGL